MAEQEKMLNFDLELATECAKAFSNTSSLGCAVSDSEGNMLKSFGYSCGNCKICEFADIGNETCIKAHIYGMSEAERFGGKYIYFCPMGFTCFVSPIIGEGNTHAKITVGPFLMVEPEDYVSVDVELSSKFNQNQKEKIINEIENIPYVEAAKVESLSTLLFMAVGFMNKVSASAKLLEQQSATEIQGQINDYIRNIKHGEVLPTYPIEIEQKLLRAISQSNKVEAAALLNDILGHIFFSSNGDFTLVKSSVYELLILISRATIEAGSDSEKTLSLSRGYLKDINNINGVDDLCLWFTNVVNKLMDGVFDFENIRHSDIIHKAIHYMRNNYSRKITLEETAKAVFLSQSYLSRIFKDETGVSFNKYLNSIRIEKSKTLLLSNEIRLADIAPLVGFEDQSYYTKVFKRTTGALPSLYRDKKGKI